MNKARRHELKMLKFKKRLKKYGLLGSSGNLHAFRSHGKPCSCSICRDEKYNRASAKDRELSELELV